MSKNTIPRHPKSLYGNVYTFPKRTYIKWTKDYVSDTRNNVGTHYVMTNFCKNRYQRYSLYYGLKDGKGCFVRTLSHYELRRYFVRTVRT